MSNETLPTLMFDEADPHEPPCPFHGGDDDPCPGTVVYMERDTEEHVYRVWCSTEGRPSEGCASDGALACSHELSREVLAWAQDMGFVEGEEIEWGDEDEY